MLNPETLPCSIEQLFNLPPPPASALATAAKPLPNKPNLVIASRGIVVDPVIAPTIAPKINIPLRVVAGEPKMIVNKVEKGLSTVWWIVIAGGALIALGFILDARHKHNIEKRNEKDSANSN